MGGQGLPQELLEDPLGGSGAPFGEPWGGLRGLEGLLGNLGLAFGEPRGLLGRPRGALWDSWGDLGGPLGTLGDPGGTLGRPLQNHPEGHVDFDSCRCSKKLY